MSPAQSSHNHNHHHHQEQYQHAKKEILMTRSTCPSSLKIHKDSHFIAKSPSSSPPTSFSSSATSLMAPAATIPKPQQHQHVQQQRHPVIIYTHSPKVIHTHPRDFKALVQKLTGQSYDDMQSANKGNGIGEGDDKNYSAQKIRSVRSGQRNFGTNEDEVSSVVTTDEICSKGLGDGQVNSRFLPPYQEPANHSNYYASLPMFATNNMDYVCPNPPLFNYNNESLYVNPTDIRSSISLSTWEGMNEFRGH